MESTLAYLGFLDESRMGLRLAICESPFTIGRGSDNHLCITDDASISPYHCAIHTTAVGLLLEDLDSSGGTLLNGQPVTGRSMLPLPSWILIGRTRLAVLPLPAQEAPHNETVHESLNKSLYTGQNTIVIPNTHFFECRTEAFLVVDLVGSTPLVQQHGEVLFSKIVAVLGRVLDRTLREDAYAFLKCTGDGYFACFSEASQALHAAILLGQALRRYFTRPLALPLQICVALHWGQARLTENGDRTGKDVHGVFGLQDLRHARTEVAAPLRDLARTDLILMTDRFQQQLQGEQRQQTVRLGQYALKGLTEDVEVFLWRGHLPG